MSEQVVDFGRYRLLPDQRLLVEGEIPVPLGGRAFDILMALVDRRSEVVSKDDLMRRVWGGQVVEDNTLAVHLSALRKALGDGKRYIGTVPGRGYQFVAPVEAVREAAAPSLEVASPGNLPRSGALLIGREAALAAVVSAIASAPLVTLAGPGGIGKTRLALAAGEQLAAEYTDGVWWVDLTAIGDPALVAGTVAQALGIQLGDAPPLPRLVAGLKGLRRLLILDNCEHVIAGVADLAVALREVGGVRLLATSLEPLSVAGELVQRLGPLAVPEASATALAAVSVPSVELFVARAQAAVQRFVLDDANVGAVVRMCRRLEGVPLALELAAVRAALLGANAMAQRLDGRLLELSSGRRDALPKHQTLRALLEWSHGLLSAAEQVVLRRLTVFAGGCTLEAAEAVVADAAVPDWQVAEHMASLIGKSLVIAERTAQGARYRLLETTRIFAAEQLETNGESAALAERHARYFTALFERAYAAWENTPDADWLRLYAPEIDNVRAAMDWTLRDPRRAQIAIALGGAAGRFWLNLGLSSEGRQYIDRALERVDQDTSPAAAAGLLRWAATLRMNSDHSQSLALAERSAALYRQAGDPIGLASVLGLVGSNYGYYGRNAEARAVLDEALEILSTSGRKKSLSALLNELGIHAVFGNNYIAARNYYARALDLTRELKQTLGESTCLSNLADVEFALGSVDRAIELASESISGWRRLNRREGLGIALSNLTSYLLLQGNPQAARPVAEEAFSSVREQGGVHLKICLEQWALLGAMEGRRRQAAVVLGFTDAGFTGSGEVREASPQQIYERLLEELHAVLPNAEFKARADQGAQLSEFSAADYTFHQLISPGLAPAVAPLGNG